LPAGAVCPSIASRAVVAERAGIGSTARLLSISAGRVTLRLVEIAGATVLVFSCSGCLLVQSRLTRGWLIQPRLIGACLIHFWLIGRTQLLAIVLRWVRLVVSKLRLIVFLIEVRSGDVVVARGVVEIVGAIIPIQVVAVNVIRVDVIAIDIVRVDVVAVDVIRIDVIAVNVVVVGVVIIVVAVDEGIRVRDIDIPVVDHRRVVSPASPRVIAPSATAATVNCRAYRDAEPE
jgi:hypothetical protein